MHSHGRGRFKRVCNELLCPKSVKEFEVAVAKSRKEMTPESAKASLIEMGLLTKAGYLSSNYYTPEEIKADKERRKNGSN